MSKGHRLSRQQKGKMKLGRRRPDADRLQPYHGRKYQAANYVEAVFLAERAILECDALTGRQLTDRHVEQSLEYLALELRGEKPARPPHGFLAALRGGGPEDLLAERIKESWRQGQVHHSLQDLSGIARTLWQSVRIRNGMGIGPRGYLDFVGDFLGDLDLSYERLDPEELDNLDLEIASTEKVSQVIFRHPTGMQRQIFPPKLVWVGDPL